MAGIRSSRQGSSERPVANRDLKPSNEVAAKMQPIARQEFQHLLKRAANQHALKRASK